MPELLQDGEKGQIEFAGLALIRSLCPLTTLFFCKLDKLSAHRIELSYGGLHLGDNFLPI